MSSIVVFPLGNVDPGVVQELSSALSETFHAEVDVRSEPVDLQQFYDHLRVQYNSTEIIRFLTGRFPVSPPVPRRQSADPKVLAVLPHDLFVPILTYVFGEAQLGGRIAVLSYHRLTNERYGLPSNPKLFRTRLRKEALHELGHAYGLIHCPDQGCVMHASTDVDAIDIKGESFCASCSEFLRTAR